MNCNSNNNKALAVTVSLLACVPGVHAAAWGAGDTVMLIFGLLLAFLFCCAALGWYSRR